MRIAMWSGPRNLSTAMMYSFGARADCDVVDEPFYASYLHKTGLCHPMRDDILRSQSIEPDVVAAELSREHPEGRHFYQKHMTQHMIDGVPRDWMLASAHVFLLRHPARVVGSYVKKREGPTLEDIGFRQQAELFDYVLDLGQVPIVIDAADIRDDPETMLKLLCDALGLPWDANMLRWALGGHPNDGVWAAHWYGAVHRSSGFADPEGPLPDLPTPYSEIVTAALPYYETLSVHALKP